jgi:hypothetical protein
MECLLQIKRHCFLAAAFFVLGLKERFDVTKDGVLFGSVIVKN